MRRRTAAVCSSKSLTDVFSQIRQSSRELPRVLCLKWGKLSLRKHCCKTLRPRARWCYQHCLSENSCKSLLTHWNTFVRACKLGRQASGSTGGQNSQSVKPFRMSVQAGKEADVLWFPGLHIQEWSPQAGKLSCFIVSHLLWKCVSPLRLHI